ncbi:MAG: hypothetical protein CMQ44_01755 [Gammaproteobacteria bacterium]|nr:hypothetical protein [Gammaproteobacteria bacterium]
MRLGLMNSEKNRPVTDGAVMKQDVALQLRSSKVSPRAHRCRSVTLKHAVLDIQRMESRALRPSTTASIERISKALGFLSAHHPAGAHRVDAR